MGLGAPEENKRSDIEKLTHCEYSKTESVIINCNFAYPINQVSKIQNPQITDALPGNTSQYKIT
jgi:hypothetical protein